MNKPEPKVIHHPTIGSHGVIISEPYVSKADYADLIEAYLREKERRVEAEKVIAEAIEKLRAIGLPEKTLLEQIAGIDEINRSYYEQEEQIKKLSGYYEYKESRKDAGAHWTLAGYLQNQNGRINKSEAACVALRTALKKAIAEADGWADEARGIRCGEVDDIRHLAQ